MSIEASRGMLNEPVEVTGAEDENHARTRSPREVDRVGDVREMMTDEDYRHRLHDDPEGEPPPRDSRVLWRRVALVVLPVFIGGSLLAATLIDGWMGFVIGATLAAVTFIASWPVLIAAWGRRVDERHMLERIARERSITINHPDQPDAKPDVVVRGPKQPVTKWGGRG